jgi:hypothetical protein
LDLSPLLLLRRSRPRLSNPCTITNNQTTRCRSNNLQIRVRTGSPILLPSWLPFKPATLPRLHRQRRLNHFSSQPTFLCSSALQPISISSSSSSSSSNRLVGVETARRSRVPKTPGTRPRRASTGRKASARRENPAAICTSEFGRRFDRMALWSPSVQLPLLMLWSFHVSTLHCMARGLTEVLTKCIAAHHSPTDVHTHSKGCVSL